MRVIRNNRPTDPGRMTNSRTDQPGRVQTQTYYDKSMLTSAIRFVLATSSDEYSGG
jgi:hypothetical protein